MRKPGTGKRRRLRAALAAFLYLAQAAWLLPGGLDLLVSRSKTVAAGESYGCADHGCGCDAEARMRKACCCSHEGQPQAESPKRSVPVSAFEEARCAGWEGTLAQLLSQPSVPLSATHVHIDQVGARLETPERRPSPFVGSSPPEKVPLV
jgi:hypothetical protein